MTLPEERYLTSDYLTENPTWDSEDSPWKAKKAAQLVMGSDLITKSMCEIGCGAGRVLAELRSYFPHSELYGFDIAQTAEQFWEGYAGANIEFCVGDFLEINKKHYDIIFLLDVIEHLRDPFDFLDKVRMHGDNFIFHFPLDLSAISVFRETPLLKVREKVGHIHYYTKGMVLALLQECGFDIIHWQYSNAGLSGPGHSWKKRLAGFPRRLTYYINKDMGVRLMGG